MYYCPAQRRTSSLLKTAVPTLKLFEPSVRTPNSKPRKAPMNRKGNCSQGGTIGSGASPELPQPQLSTPRRPGRPQKSLEQLRKLLNNACAVIRRQKHRIANLKASVARTRIKQKVWQQVKLPLATVLAAAQNRLTATAYGYISDLLRNALRKRPTWSAHSIRLATGCYHYSPCTARYWHNIGLRLPSRSTTRKYIGKCLRSPGPCPKVFSMLKHMAPKAGRAATPCDHQH